MLTRDALRLWILVATLTCAAHAQVSVSIQQPYFGFSPIPGESLRVFGVVTGGTSNQLTWMVTSTTGGASVTSITRSAAPNLPGNYVDITLGSVGATCTVSGTAGTNYVLSSNANVVLTATSVDNPSVSASAIINICNPPHTIHIMGSYETLFAAQQDELEAKVWGLINKNVTWSVQQPADSDATLSDTTHNTLAFSATKPGRYTFTATSVADASISATIVRYVSGVPYPGMTPLHTIPVDCSIDPALTGTTYDIGPGKTYATIGAALAVANVSSTQQNPTDQNYLPPGTTFRVWNVDTTGTAPTRYHEYVLLAGQGTVTQPIRMLGCANSFGYLPIMDMQDAVSVPNNTAATPYTSYGTGNQSYYQIGLNNFGHTYSSYPDFPGQTYFGIEGFSFRNGWSDDGEPLQSGGTDHAPAITPSFYPPASTTEYPVGSNLANIHIFTGDQVSIRGNDLQNGTFGILADFNGNEDWGGFAGDINIEGNAASNGGDWSTGTHEMYIQGFRQRVWNNWFGAQRPFNNGILLKIRGVDNTISYNSFQNGSQARVVDLVDNTDSPNFMDMNSYLYLYYQTAGSPLYTPDMVSAGQEAWLHDSLYGNSFNMATGPQPPQSISLIHYFLDQAGADDHSSFPYRRGQLNFYDNTIALGSNVTTRIFDTYQGGDRIRAQWPTINVFNNAIFVNPLNTVQGQSFIWSSLRSDFLNVGRNWINTRWGTNDQNCLLNDGSCFATGWSSSVATTSPYMDASNLPAHLTDFLNVIVGPNTLPFNALNLTPTEAGGLIGAATPAASLPAELSTRPVRFQKSTTNYALQPRADLTTIGAFDYNSNAPQIISIALPTMSASVLLGYTNMPPVTCYYDDGTSQTCSYASNAYTWSVSNSSVLSVSSTGVVTGLGAGSALVTATINGMSSSQAVTVRPLVPMFTGNFKIVGVRVN